jgi:hypothetical protein
MLTYMHDLPDRPRFRWDHAALAVPLAAVRHHQGRLVGRTEGLGFELRGEAVLQSLAEEILKSSDIEGERLDRAQPNSASRITCPPRRWLSWRSPMAASSSPRSKSSKNGPPAGGKARCPCRQRGARFITG